MRRTFAALAPVALACLALAGCTTSLKPYGPASDGNSQGFTEQKIESGRYQVSYTAPDRSSAEAFALRRAAELALAEGHDWFEVTNSFAEDERRASRSGTSVGVGVSGGSGGGVSTGVGIGIGLPLGGGGGGLVTVSLGVISGPGEKPLSPNAYDARSVLANIAPE